MRVFKIWFATSQEGGRKKVVVVVEDVVACAVAEVVVVVEQCDRRNLEEAVADNQTDQSQSCLQVAAVVVAGTNVQSKYHHQ